MEHTKGKWKAKEVRGSWDIYTDEAWIGNIYLGHGQRIGKEAEANARRICLCVNSHDALLAICKELLSANIYADAEGLSSIEEGACDDNIVKRAKQAIASAEAN